MSGRKHLVSAEVEKLMEAAKSSRNAARDRCFLLLMFRHGLRVSETCGLKLSQVDTESRVLHVKRLKAGLSTTHPLRGDELRVVKTWLAERAKMKPETDAFFISERRGPLSRKTAWVMIRDYGKQADLAVDTHPHMLRHACGFALADQGAGTRLIQDYLGHRNIQHTVRYTATNPARSGIWSPASCSPLPKSSFSTRANARPQALRPPRRKASIGAARKARQSPNPAEPGHSRPRASPPLKSRRSWAYPNAPSGAISMLRQSITGSSRRCPLGLCHGYAIHALSKNVPLNMVSKRMGHAQMETTAIYANAVGEEQQSIAARMWA